MYKEEIAKVTTEELLEDFNMIVHQNDRALELIIELKSGTKCYYQGNKNMLCISKNNFKFHLNNHIKRIPQRIADKWKELQEEVI